MKFHSLRVDHLTPNSQKQYAHILHEKKFAMNVDSADVPILKAISPDDLEK